MHEQTWALGLHSCRALSSQLRVHFSRRPLNRKTESINNEQNPKSVTYVLTQKCYLCIDPTVVALNFKFAICNLQSPVLHSGGSGTPSRSACWYSVVAAASFPLSLAVQYCASTAFAEIGLS